MGAELIPTMTGSDSGMETTTECDVTLRLPGDVEGLRPRLMAALEKLGYRVLSEQPLQAKRAPQGWGVWSACLLDYPTSLLLGFKSSGERATQVTFSYTVKHASGWWLSKGDLQTLAREAEAIAALATQRSQATTCAACGTQSPTESRFCRRCGAPFVAPEPAELEVLRLTAGSRAGYQTVVTGAIFLAAMMLCLLPLYFNLPAKAATALFWVAVGLGLAGWITMLFAMRRLHCTLNPKQEKDAPSISQQPPLQTPQTTALPPEYTPMSVTETTTELLQSAEAAPPIQSPDRRRDTA